MTQRLLALLTPTSVPRGITMVSLNKFGKQRLKYLKSRQPKILRKLTDHGILESHLLYAQQRAAWQMKRLMRAGLKEFEAAEIVLQAVILT